MFEVFLYGYVTAVGFVFAGLCQSLAQWVTGRPLGFALETDAGLPAIAGIFGRMFAGPAILMRNAVLGAVREGREPFWLVLSTFIAAIWSFLSGILVLAVVLSVS